jgi:hypothetical protein
MIDSIPTWLFVIIFSSFLLIGAGLWWREKQGAAICSFIVAGIAAIFLLCWIVSSVWTWMERNASLILATAVIIGSILIACGLTRLARAIYVLAQTTNTKKNPPS